MDFTSDEVNKFTGSSSTHEKSWQDRVDICKAYCNYYDKELSWNLGSSTSHLNRYTT